MQATHIRTRSRITHGATIDGVEVELTFEPTYEGHILAERVGDKLVVAYLVQDSDPQNPQEDGCANGDIYTRSEYGYGGGSISDNDSEIYAALGVDGYGSPDIDKIFGDATALNPPGASSRAYTLREAAARQYLDDVGGNFNLIERWLDESNLELDEGETFEQAFQTHHDDIWRDLEDPNGVFCDEVEELAISLYPTYWQQIAGPFVVPLDYCDSNHGPGTMSISPTTWDGDFDDLPTGIWVADKEAIENLESSALPTGVDIRWLGAVGIGGSTLHAVISKDGADVFDAGVESGSWHRALEWAKATYGAPTDSDLRDAAAKYAEGVCSSYQAWANGDVYGCVVEIFDKVGDDDDIEWEPDSEHDSCWGFIGGDYALDTLKSEYFEPTVKRLQEAQV